METIKPYISTIENSDNPLTILTKTIVNELMGYYLNNLDVDLSYQLRDDTVIHTLETYRKKYLNDSRFIENPSKIIKIIAKNYLFKKFGKLNN